MKSQKFTIVIFSHKKTTFFNINSKRKNLKHVDFLKNLKI